MINKNHQFIAAVFSATAVIFIFGLSLIFAHGGEDHGETSVATPGGGGLSAPLLVEKESQFLLGILTEPAAMRRLKRSVRVLGRVIPRTQGKAEIISLQSGQVIEDPRYPMPQIGDFVRKGQVMAVLEQALGTAEILDLQAAKVKADAELAQSRKEYNRLKSIEKVVAQKDLIEAEIRLQTARKVQQLYDETIANTMSLSSGGRYSIRSPISGIVTDADVTLGEQVEANKKIFNVIDLQTLWVEAQVYETDLARVEQSQEAQIATQVYPGQYFTGHLHSLGSVVDEDTRTVRAIFEVKNTNRKLRVGMFADVSVEIGGPEEVLAVSRSAVTTVGGKNVLFLHLQPEYFLGREVLLGDQDGDFVEIKSGLKPGERVVTTGNYQLKSIAQAGG